MPKNIHAQEKNREKKSSTEELLEMVRSLRCRTLPIHAPFGFSVSFEFVFSFKPLL